MLHLRHASGGGGGADAVVFQDIVGMDAGRFLCRAAYLRKHREQPALMIRRLQDGGVDCRDLPGRAVLDLGQVMRLARLIAAADVRILHCHDPKAYVYGALLRLIRPRIKLVGTLHGWTVKVRREILYNWLALRALRRFDAVLTVSEDLQRRAGAAGLTRVRLVPNALDVGIWRRNGGGAPVAGPRAPVCAVGFVGRLSPEKGALDFVRVAHRVADRGGACEFFVAGEGPEKPAMTRLAAQLGVEGRLRFLGQLGEEELRGLYRRLDQVLLTSHTEGLPMVVLEALAMSLPVVATRVGGVGEVIDHDVTGLLSEPGDVEGLASQVLSLARSPDLRERLGSAGRRLVEGRYSLQGRTAAIAELYRELLRCPGTAPCKP